MKGWKLLAILVLVGVMIVGAAGFAFARGPRDGAVPNPAPRLPQGRAIVGVVAAIGENVITVQTVKESVEVAVNEETVYRMPPEEEITLVDLQNLVNEAAAKGVKVRVTILATKDKDSFTAKRVMVLTPPPPKPWHFTGEVTAIGENSVTATGADGKSITINFSELPEGIELGQGVVLGIGPKPVLKQGLEGAKERLEGNIQRHLEKIEELGEKLRERAHQALEKAKARFETATGVIQAVDTNANTITMTTGKGETVTLVITEQTKILKNGAPATIDGLSVGDAVKVVYQEEGLKATVIYATSPAPAKTTSAKTV